MKAPGPIPKTGTKKKEEAGWIEHLKELITMVCKTSESQIGYWKPDYVLLILRRRTGRWGVRHWPHRLYGSSLGSCPAWLENTAGEIKQQFTGLGWQKVGTDVCGSFLLSPQPSAPRCFRDRSTGMKKRAKETVATRVCGVRCWRWGRPMKGHGVTWGSPVDSAVYQELCVYWMVLPDSGSAQTQEL